MVSVFVVTLSGSSRSARVTALVVDTVETRPEGSVVTADFVIDAIMPNRGSAAYSMVDMVPSGEVDVLE